MAITKGAKKAHRASLRKRVFNLRRKRTMAEATKTVRAVGGKSKEELMKALSEAYKAIDKAMKRGVIKMNTAARKKSRLAKFLKASAK